MLRCVIHRLFPVVLGLSVISTQGCVDTGWGEVSFKSTNSAQVIQKFPTLKPLLMNAIKVDMFSRANPGSFVEMTSASYSFADIDHAFASWCEWLDEDSRLRRSVSRECEGVTDISECWSFTDSKNLLRIDSEESIPNWIKQACDVANVTKSGCFTDAALPNLDARCLSDRGALVIQSADNKIMITTWMSPLPPYETQNSPN